MKFYYGKGREILNACEATVTHIIALIFCYRAVQAKLVRCEDSLGTSFNARDVNAKVAQQEGVGGNWRVNVFKLAVGWATFDSFH